MCNGNMYNDTEQNTSSKYDDCNDDEQPILVNNCSSNLDHDNMNNVYNSAHGTLGLVASKFFFAMVKFPWLFAALFPVICVVLIGIGMTREDIIERDMSNIWMPTSGTFARDKQYAQDLIDKHNAWTTGEASYMAALAIARDGGNLMQKDRLEKIRQRMEETERTTIEYKNQTYTWDDICYINNLGDEETTYQFPCMRASPMDFFEEANWYFTEQHRVSWFQASIGDLAKSQFARYGVMNDHCVSDSLSPNRLFAAAPTIGKATDDCDYYVKLRSDPDFAVQQGYPLDYAGNPMGLFLDITSIDFHDPCRICIETNYERIMKVLLEDHIVPLFQNLGAELEIFYNNSMSYLNSTEQSKLQKLIENSLALAGTITRPEVEEFYMYYTIRSIYATLGGEQYVELYKEVVGGPELSIICGMFPQLTCPPLGKDINMTVDDGIKAMLNHADHDFSSINSAGAPFPLWSDIPKDGGQRNHEQVQYLFDGTSPVGGSGIDMSGSLFELEEYFHRKANNILSDKWDINADLNPFEETKINENSSSMTSDSTTLWGTLVQKNPFYAWFMASLEPMNAHCGNGNLIGTNTGVSAIDDQSNEFTGEYSERWCTKYDVPYEVDDTYTRQYFGKLWYNILLNSEYFLDMRQGESDPYTFTFGMGCDYALSSPRYSYENRSDEFSILAEASSKLYAIDEGVMMGEIDKHSLMGDIEYYTEEEIENDLSTEQVEYLLDYWAFNHPYRNSVNTKKFGKDQYQNITSSLPVYKRVGMIQTVYPTMATPSDIVRRVAHSNRPNDGPINITQSDAKEILRQFKIALEKSWSKDWQNDSEELQFVAFFDDNGALGTTGRFLQEATLSSGFLTAISILVIMVFSIGFLFHRHPIQSQMLITFVGVVLVVLSFFAATAFSILLGIKINITIAWTLPFIILGIGVDNIYIVLLGLRTQGGRSRGGYSKEGYVKALKDIIIPVTMTSLVNASMFAIMNLSDIPAVFLTARVALIAILFLYVAVVFCYPAYCYLDFQRQQNGRRDILCCWKHSQTQRRSNSNNDSYLNLNSSTYYHYQPDAEWQTVLYTYIYKPIVLGSNPIFRLIAHCIIWILAIGLLAVGVYGCTQRQVGLGLEDIFPSNSQAYRWSKARATGIASWDLTMEWGALDYKNPDTQMRMMKQFEDVVDTDYVSATSTDRLWISKFALWTTRLCQENVFREDSSSLLCGRDQEFYSVESYGGTVVASVSSCAGSWRRNKYNLRKMQFINNAQDACLAPHNGICRPTSHMHADDLRDAGIDPDNISKQDQNEIWCPVFGFDDVESTYWSDEKLKFCLEKWNDATGTANEFLLVDSETKEIIVPLQYSAGPVMFGINLFSHEITLDLITQTRDICDNDPYLHCWMTGVPFDFWSQYIGIFSVLIQMASASIMIGFVVSFLFLFMKFYYYGWHSSTKVFCGSLVGALLIALTTLFSLICTVGLSVLSNVSITGFSNMSFGLSVGFAVEYSVHIVARWLRADVISKDDEGSCATTASLDRMEYTMSFLTLPTFMSFISSTIGVVCLAFTKFEFNERYFFRPLIIVMFVTYFYGCWWLPVCLSHLNCDFLKLGKSISKASYSAKTGNHQMPTTGSEAQVDPATSTPDSMAAREPADVFYDARSESP